MLVDVFMLKITKIDVTLAALSIGVFCLALLMTHVLPVGIYRCVGNSMYPTFSREEILLVLHVSGDTQFKAGAIIVYESDGVLIAHRVIDIKEEQVITKGDNNKEVEIIEKKKIKGIVIAHV